jgi:lipid-binding SYLF domain-containing protein
MKLFAKLTAAVALTGALVATPALARTDTQELLDHANHTVSLLRHDSVFGDARHNLRGARAVLIFPNLVKGGFIFGAEGGDGVLMARTRHGWSAPAFYSLGSASFGFQAGLQDAQVVMVIMTDRALRAIERSKFKFGAGAGLTVVTMGAGVEGATSGNMTGDIVLWSKSEGVYGGISINGSVVAPEEDTNDDFYGHNTDVDSILSGHEKNRAARSLQSNLGAAF